MSGLIKQGFFGLLYCCCRFCCCCFATFFFFLKLFIIEKTYFINYKLLTNEKNILPPTLPIRLVAQNNSFFLTNFLQN